MKYSANAVKVLLKPIGSIAGRPTFSSLYQLAQSITNCLRKINHPTYPDNGFLGYMMSPEAFRLFNARMPWIDPADVGEFFVVPSLTITDMEQHVEQSK